MEEQFEDFIVQDTKYIATEQPYWKELEDTQIQLIHSIVRRTKIRTSVKEMIVTELDYAKKEKDSIGLYKREWELVVQTLKDKVDMKGTRNKDELHYLIRILSSFIKKEMI